MNQLAVSLAKIADGIGTLLNSPIIVAIIALFGVVLTAHSSRKVAFAQNLHERLSTYYAEVFSNYSLLITITAENRSLRISSFIGSCEKAMMICSEESIVILKELEDIAFRDDINTKYLGDLFERLRVSSRKDLNNIIPRKDGSLFHRLWTKLKKNCQN